MQKQLDGAADTSDEDASDVSDDNLDGDDDDDLDKDDDDEIDGEGGAEEEPLNSDDDVSEEEQADLFDTDNVVVCQYDKVSQFIYVYRCTRVGMYIVSVEFLICLNYVAYTRRMGDFIPPLC